MFKKAVGAVKNFVKGAVASAPMTLLYSGVAFAGSAVMHSAFGVSPLGITTATTAAQIATRMVGSLLIGGTINGTINAYKNWNTPDAPMSAVAPVQTPGANTNPSVQTQIVQQLTAPFTPGARPEQEHARF